MITLSLSALRENPQRSLRLCGYFTCKILCLCIGKSRIAVNTKIFFPANSKIIKQV
jgi:hypothetical protein